MSLQSISKLFFKGVSNLVLTYTYLKELGYGSDLNIDSDDEKKISAMNDLEREMLLDERNKKRELLMEKYELQK